MRTGTDWLAGAEAGSASGSLARSVTSRPELRRVHGFFLFGPSFFGIPFSIRTAQSSFSVKK